MRTDALRSLTAYGSLHLARKAEQVPQELKDSGSSKRTCPLCSLSAEPVTDPVHETTLFKPVSGAQMFLHYEIKFGG